MIIKCISRKSNVDQLIKYVLAPCKMEEKIQQPKWPVYLSGIHLSEDDLHHLHAEYIDALLMQELKEHSKDGDIAKFVTEYILQQQNEKENQKKKLPAILIKENIRARTIRGYIKAFAENEKLRLHVRNNNVKAYHHIISFSNLDKGHMDEKMLKDIAQQYISLRGDNSLFLGAVHQDKEHLHIHLIQSGTQYCTGLANRVSRQQFQELKVAMQEYQVHKYPQLMNSVVNLQSKNTKAKGMNQGKNIKTHDERTSTKQTLLGLLETTFRKAASKEQFLDEIKKAGHEPYFRNGRLQGIKYDGDQKFRFSSLGFKSQLEELEHLTDTVKAKEPDFEKFAQNMRDERTAIAQHGKLVEADYDKFSKQYEQGPEKIDQEKELQELQMLRSRHRSRVRNTDRKEQPDKAVLYEDKIEGKSESEIRDIQQDMVNVDKEFEREHGIIRDNDLPPENEGSHISLYNTYIDRLCDDCKQESKDPSYENPKYYVNGKFDAEKYQNHLSEELQNVVDVSAQVNADATDRTVGDKNWDILTNNDNSDSRDNSESNQPDDSRNEERDDLAEGRDNDKSGESERDDDDYDFDR